MTTAETKDSTQPVGSGAMTGSALPTPDEIKADPDRILELYDCCPKCGSTALEALTWESIGADDVTVGCWNPDCDWWITPPGYDPDTQND